ncbi:hypothetical protein E2562_001922 [Oryza meyeriana var. granulata]|uniref:Uncharacterized protein n=1 Tax=Oryza meyeriana var. granulata TaxID=110450 RepID=A0A6G1C3A6_9ORYZ|nr:hypothetical protein E2562_001922 [Oryza meyeriana var. granulata]
MQAEAPMDGWGSDAVVVVAMAVEGCELVDPIQEATPANGWGSDAVVMTVASLFMVFLQETVVAAEKACRLAVMIQEAVVVVNGGGLDAAAPSEACKAAPLEACKMADLMHKGAEVAEEDIDCGIHGLS